MKTFNFNYAHIKLEQWAATTKIKTIKTKIITTIIVKCCHLVSNSGKLINKNFNNREKSAHNKDVVCRWVCVGMCLLMCLCVCVSVSATSISEQFYVHLTKHLFYIEALLNTSDLKYWCEHARHDLRTRIPYLCVHMLTYVNFNYKYVRFVCL